MQLQALSLINHSKHSLKHIQNHTSLLKSVFPISSQLSSKKCQKVGLDSLCRLLYCSSKGDKAGVMHELEKGVKPNLADYDKRTALHLASCEGCTEIVDLLLHKGADVNSTDRWGCTPLSDARSFSHEAICKILEARGGIDPVGLDSQLPCYEIEHTEVNMDEATLIGESSGTRVMMWQKESREWIPVGRLSSLLTRPPCQLVAIGKKFYVVGKGLSTVMFDVENAGNMEGVMVSSSIPKLNSDDDVISCKCLSI